MLKMLPITVIGTHTEQQIYALIDEGSTVTLLNSKIFNTIGGEKTRFKVSLKGVGSNRELANINQKVNIKLKNNNDLYTLTGVLLIDDLALPMQHVLNAITDLCYEKTNIL